MADLMQLRAPLLRRLLAVAVFITLGVLTACQRPKPSPIPWVNCGNTIVFNDFHDTLLLEFLPQRPALIQREAFTDPKSVIGQALLLCNQGGVAYTTEARMSAASRAVLHLRTAGREQRLAFREGINVLIPWGDNGLLVNTNQLQRSALDPALGYLSEEELRSTAGRAALPAASAAASDTQHLHVGLVTIDLERFSRQRHVRAPLMPLWLQTGKVVFYAAEGKAFSLDPATGQRTWIQTYDEPDGRWPGVRVTAQGIRRLYVHGNEVYAVSGVPYSPPHPGPRLAPDGIFRFDAQAGRWQELGRFGFNATAYVMAGDQLVIMGQDRMALFDLPSSRLRVMPLPLEGGPPVSVAAIDAGWAIATYAPERAKAEATPAADLWIVAPDGSRVLYRHPLPGMGSARLSTRRSPVHEW